MGSSKRLTFEMTIVFRNERYPSGVVVNSETIEVFCAEEEIPRRKAEEALDRRNEELRKEGKGHEAHFGKLYKSY